MKEINLLKMKSKEEHTIDNPWHVLREYTAARIGLGRAGISMPTNHLLDFQLAHAQAQDTVHLPLDTQTLITDIQSCGGDSDIPNQTLALHCILVHSQVVDRSQYLQRPDLGRRLNSASVAALRIHAAVEDEPYDLAIVIVDGLSSFAIQKNTSPLLQQLIQRVSLQALSKSKVKNDEAGIFRLAPIVVVEQGRVAIGDEVGELLNAKSVLVFIGERPGLSSPDSLGLYLTWAPKVGLTDESRNCISNVRPEGLEYSKAVNKVIYLLSEAHQRQLSGVNLKERTQIIECSLSHKEKNFLIS